MEPVKEIRVIHVIGPLDDGSKCPECGAPVKKQVARVNSAFPDGPAALRNMGMARLERRSDGMYENVSAQPGAERGLYLRGLCLRGQRQCRCDRRVPGLRSSRGS